MNVWGRAWLGFSLGHGLGCGVEHVLGFRGGHKLVFRVDHVLEFRVGHGLG